MVYSPLSPNGTGILAGLHANSGNLSYRIDNVHRLKRLNLDIFFIVAMEEAKARLMKRLLIKTPVLLAKRFFKDGVSLFTRYFFPFVPLGWAISSILDAIDKLPHLKTAKLFLYGTQDEIAC